MRVKLGSSWIPAAVCAAVVFGFWPASPARAVVVWQEVGGQVVIEAEEPFSAATGDVNGATFDILHSGVSNFRGDGFVQILPDGAGGGGSIFSDDGPINTYYANFNTPGTYRLWHRGNGPDYGGDSGYVRVFRDTPGDYYLVVPAGNNNDFDDKWSDQGRLNTGSLGSTSPIDISIPTPGIYTIQLAQREDGTRFDSLLLDRTGTFAGADPGPAASPAPFNLAFQEAGGQVVIEAEHFKSRTAGPSDSYSVENLDGASGGIRNDLYVRAGPNNLGGNTGTPFDTGPTLRYDAWFQTPGTYQAWVRTASNPDGEPTGNDDSLYVRVYRDTPGDFYLVDGGGDWAWRGTGFLNVTGFSGPRVDTDFLISAPGIYTIELALREDGTDVDALLLDRTGTFGGGTGLGPAESAFLAVPEPAALALILLGGLGAAPLVWRRHYRGRA